MGRHTSNDHEEEVHQGCGWGRREKKIMGEYDQTTLFTRMKSHDETYSFVDFIYALKALKANK